MEKMANSTATTTILTSMKDYSVHQFYSLVKTKSEQQKKFGKELEDAVNRRDFGMMHDLLTSVAQTNFEVVNDYVVNTVIEKLVGEKTPQRKVKSPTSESKLDVKKVQQVIREVMAEEEQAANKSNIDHGK